jgi:hypothetical protein
VLSGINFDGTVTGYYVDTAGDSHGFVRGAKGLITTFDVPGALQTTPLSINESGTVTGTFNSNGGFLRAANGSIVEFGVPRAGRTIPSGINAAGTVTGTYMDASGEYHGFLLVP